MSRIVVGLLVLSVLAGCASSGPRAPVVKRGASPKAAPVNVKSTEKDWRPRVYVVQKGDTLFAIAFNYGLDPRELAEQNAIQDPNLIKVGQQINLFAGAGAGAVAPRAAVVESKISLVKDQPKVVKYPYSESAISQAEGGVAKAEAKPKAETKAESKPEAKPESKAETVAEADDALEWSMPAQGKIIAGFSEADNRKGVDIAGKLGQSIFASAPGKVVYSGSGLRGYGKLLIIKHNKTYLSAYAHNDQLLVKEGESVTRGQKIAEMGNSDSDQVKLHFEVRRLGKPVDPAGYLALNKP